MAAIGRQQLQDYYNRWIESPIARKFGISHLIVGAEVRRTANLDFGERNRGHCLAFDRWDEPPGFDNAGNVQNVKPLLR